jgi:hypothetical protein
MGARKITGSLCRSSGPKIAPVVTPETVRRLALELPEAVERDHHGRPSFRVGGRIFATQWDEAHLNVMLDGPATRTFVQGHPGACEELWWGKRLSGVRMGLALADEALVRDLLADAWEQKAPKRLR